jgi:hypothetical protein
VPCSSCSIDIPGPFSSVISATSGARVLGLLRTDIDGNSMYLYHKGGGIYRKSGGVYHKNSAVPPHPHPLAVAMSML